MKIFDSRFVEWFGLVVKLADFRFAVGRGRFGDPGACLRKESILDVLNGSEGVAIGAVLIADLFTPEIGGFDEL